MNVDIGEANSFAKYIVGLFALTALIVAIGTECFPLLTLRLRG